MISSNGHFHLISLQKQLQKHRESPEIRDLEGNYNHKYLQQMVHKWPNTAAGSSYDSEADVFYLHFKKPNHADDSQIADDEIIVRTENKEVIGMTILNASQQIKSTIL